MVIHALPYIVAIHLALSIWIFGNPQVFASADWRERISGFRYQGVNTPGVDVSSSGQMSHTRSSKWTIARRYLSFAYIPGTMVDRQPPSLRLGRLAGANLRLPIPGSQHPRRRCEFGRSQPGQLNHIVYSNRIIAQRYLVLYTYIYVLWSIGSPQVFASADWRDRIPGFRYQGSQHPRRRM
jgi:hypothetical protein